MNRLERYVVENERFAKIVHPEFKITEGETTFYYAKVHPDGTMSLTGRLPKLDVSSFHRWLGYLLEDEDPHAHRIDELIGAIGGVHGD